MTNPPLFKTTVASLLNNWDAIQFAVQHRTGGPQSEEIAQWLINVTENYFYDNEELEAEEVAGFLSTIMDQELNTLVEDGSDLSIGHQLVKLYSLCISGQTEEVMQELARFPKCSESLRRVQGSDEEEGDDAPMHVASQMSNLQLDSVGDESIPVEHSAINGMKQVDGTVSADTSMPDQEEVDGWTVIRKGKKKR